MRFLTVLALAGISSAAPAKPNEPSVTIKNGTVIGQSANCIDTFNGIRFAKPPTDDLRLRAPQSLDKHYGTVKLPTIANACPQMKASPVNTTGLPAKAIEALEFIGAPIQGPSSEDCLFINVQRPADIKPGQKLPVLFWIYGGAYQTGSTQSYDGSRIVNKSRSLEEPVIFVAANYRLNAFGYLQGKELQAEGNTNLGHRDQRKALEWVAENIEAFGGDPDRVTIWGESAGAMSVSDHLVINNGDHTYRGKPLFRGAIMNSGTIFPNLPANSAKAQDVFKKVAKAAGCGTAKNPLSCLRKVNTTTFIDAVNTQPHFLSNQSTNSPFGPRPDLSDSFYPFPDKAFAEGKFAHVPIIAGNQEDEATPFAVSQRAIINDTDSLVSYYSKWFPNACRKTVARYIATYPNNPSAGLPAGTGSKWELYPQYKRSAAITSDLVFMAGRRIVLRHVKARGVPTWSYLATYFHDVPQFGTWHVSDVPTQFGLREDSFPGNTMDAAYLTFVNHLNPNGESSGYEKDKKGEWWPQWDAEHLRLLNISASETSVIKDDFRWKSQQFIADHYAELSL